jgi:hypothetical protein
MKKQQWIIAAIALILMGGTAVLLGNMRNNQRLGEPGVKTAPLPDSKRLEVILPENVLNFASKKVEQEQMVLDALPQDTSFGQRLYRAPDGFEMLINVVLMGGDRTSLHKPQFCLEGAGWAIDHGASSLGAVRIDRPQAYDLPVMKLIATKEGLEDGKKVTRRGIYVYYYVADNAISAGALGYERMWWMARELVTTGVLQRWAYVTFFAVCAPGQEEATYGRMKAFITAAVPEFQTEHGDAPK